MAFSSGQRSGKELIYVSKLPMEFFACLIIFMYERLLVRVGLYEAGQPSLEHNWGKLIWSDQTHHFLRMRNMQKPEAKIISGKSGQQSHCPE